MERVIRSVYGATKTKEDSLRILTVNEEPLVAALVRLDKSTFLHSLRTQKLAAALGKILEVSVGELHLLSIGALLHDIGKYYVPERILNKTTPLTAQEKGVIKSHSALGYYYLQPMALSEQIKEMVLCHHRWADGEGGYPKFAAVKKPSFLTQIVTVADVGDAMLSDRAYRPPLSVPECIGFLEKNTPHMFNRDVVKAFKNFMGGKGGISP